MVIINSHLLNRFHEIVFGFSTKLGPGEPPYYFNLSMSVGDDPEKVKERRKNFFNSLGIGKIAYQKQVHGNTIRYIEHEGFAGESDAMITDKPDLGLLISAADCTSIYIYDSKKRIAAGIHAGWRGTVAGITEKTISELITNYKCSPGNLWAYIAPSISKDVYEVNSDVAEQFEEKYYIPRGEKYLLDVAGKNYDALKAYGLPDENIQYSTLCTYKLNHLLHSYRRDGLHSGRSVGIIAMRKRK